MNKFSEKPIEEVKPITEESSLRDEVACSTDDTQSVLEEIQVLTNEQEHTPLTPSSYIEEAAVLTWFNMYEREKHH